MDAPAQYKVVEGYSFDLPGIGLEPEEGGVQR